MAQLSDDCFAFGGPLMSVDDAVAIIAARVSAVQGVETVALSDADGHILAQDVVAPLPLPPFTNSAVDGYAVRGGDLSGGFYMQPTIFTGNNKMRVFQEEIFGPVVAVTSFTDYDDAISIANDTLYGLGAGVWSRDGNTAYRAGRDIQAGRVWTNCYHAYPAHAAFGGYKQSGIGRENHKMMLDHYQQTKNLLVSYSNKAQGFF